MKFEYQRYVHDYSSRGTMTQVLLLAVALVLGFISLQLHRLTLVISEWTASQKRLGSHGEQRAEASQLPSLQRKISDGERSDETHRERRLVESAPTDPWRPLVGRSSWQVPDSVSPTTELN